MPTASANGLQGPEASQTDVSGNFLFSAIVGFIYGYLAEQLGRTVHIVMAGFADTSSMAYLSPAPSQVGICSRLEHRRKEKRGKKRGMLKVTDWGFHDSGFTTAPAVFHVTVLTTGLPGNSL